MQTSGTHARRQQALAVIACSIALVWATPAAADGPYYRGGGVKDTYIPVAPIVPVFNWTGFYTGASLGGRAATIDADALGSDIAPPLDNFAADFDSGSFRFGAYGGVNWQISPNWLIGVEGDIAWADSDRTTNFLLGVPFTAGDSTEVRHSWDGSVRGRVGMLLVPSVLLYATGGVTWQHIEATAYGPVSFGVGSHTVDKTLTGWTVGGGLEGVLGSRWLGRIEYRYSDYGTETLRFFPEGLAVDVDTRTSTFFVGLAYKF